MTSGRKYYRYRNNTLDQGFPKPLSQGFFGLPSYLDAAFVRDNKIYFLKRNKMWIFSPKLSPPMSQPKPLPPGIDERVVAAVDIDKNTTFIFSKDKYWKLDERYHSLS